MRKLYLCFVTLAAFFTSYCSFATQLTDVNLGNPPGSGSASYSATTNSYTLTGVGTFGGADYNTFGNLDYLAIVGNFDVRAQVLSSTAASWSGLLAINTLNSQDIYAATVLNLATLPASGEYFYASSYDGAYTKGGTGADSSYSWARLTRSGNTFSEYVSSDGNAWTLLNSETLAMNNIAYVGLFTSYGGSTPVSTTFSDLSGFPQLTAPATNDSTGVPAPSAFSFLLAAISLVFFKRRGQSEPLARI